MILYLKIQIRQSRLPYSARPRSYASQQAMKLSTKDVIKVASCMTLLHITEQSQLALPLMPHRGGAPLRPVPAGLWP